MKLNFTFKHLDRSEALETHAVDRMESVGRFLLKDGFGMVYFSKQKHEFCVEVSVNTREKYFRAISYHADPYLAVDAVVEKLEKQFLKSRKLVQDHKKPHLSKAGRLEQLNERFETKVRFRKAA